MRGSKLDFLKVCNSCRRSIYQIKFFTSLCGVRLVVCISPHLNVLRISSVKQCCTAIINKQKNNCVQFLSRSARLESDLGIGSAVCPSVCPSVTSWYHVFINAHTITWFVFASSSPVTLFFETIFHVPKVPWDPSRGLQTKLG